jgi:hypothetical protein
MGRYNQDQITVLLIEISERQGWKENHQARDPV